jgi:hypothetical protein
MLSANPVNEIPALTSSLPRLATVKFTGQLSLVTPCVEPLKRAR